MKNRIRFKVNAAFEKKYLDHLNALIEMNTEIILNTNADDLQKDQNMGTKTGVRFAKDGYAIAKEHPKLLDEENVTVQDYEDGIVRNDFLMQVQEKQAILQRQTNQAVLLTGKDLMEKSNWVLNALRIRQHVPLFKELFERLYSVYKQRIERSDATKKLKATFFKKNAEL